LRKKTAASPVGSARQTQSRASCGEIVVAEPLGAQPGSLPKKVTAASPVGSASLMQSGLHCVVMLAEGLVGAQLASGPRAA
jgi:hypothetical protein